MNKWITVFAVALACAGCFDNKGKPEDVPTVVGLKALASTNRTGIVRVILRGDKGALTADMLTNLDAVKMIDLSERGTASVQPEVLKLKGIKEFYFAANGMVNVPDLSGWAATLDYLNLDNNSIKELPESMAKLTGLKWLRLNGNQLKGAVNMLRKAEILSSFLSEIFRKSKVTVLIKHGCTPKDLLLLL